MFRKLKGDCILNVSRQLLWDVVLWCCGMLCVCVCVCVCFTERCEVTNFISFCLRCVNFFNKQITKIGNIKNNWWFLCWFSLSCPKKDWGGDLLLRISLRKIGARWRALACTVSQEPIVLISSQFCFQWHHIGGLKLAILGVFTPQKLANTANQWSGELAVRHLPAHHWDHIQWCNI